MNDSKREEHLHDLRLVGESSSNGGIFQKVHVTGDAEIHGSLDCRTFKCTGNTKVDGSLRSDSIRTTGNLEIEGELHVAKMRLTGEIRAKGSVSCEELHVFGNTIANRGIQAEQLRLKGGIQTEGMLNAERLELRMIGRSKTGEIAGTSIDIAPHMAQKWTPWIRLGETPELEASVIEGDVIRLENTQADIVRGGDVTIGPGCRIRLVEYSIACHRDKQAEVGQSVKIDPPL
ncbi:hypothetical protein V3851_20025 [Paenibacillus sp. M1]|uniref:Polymer-forming cytoskeletal protein n=1 Tax=Paenibacillus haidiansis TaxID=1574488 RepID=A0ABU7VWI4_9BACL